MKNATLLLSLVLLFYLSLLLACHKPKPPVLTPQQEQAKLLKWTWSHVTDVTVPINVDTTILDNLTMTFNVDNNYNPTTFNVNGADNFFQVQGNATWNFYGSDISIVNFTYINPVTQINIKSISEHLLTISFDYAGLRSEGIGNYQVTLSKWIIKFFKELSIFNHLSSISIINSDDGWLRIEDWFDYPPSIINPHFQQFDQRSRIINASQAQLLTSRLFVKFTIWLHQRTI